MASQNQQAALEVDADYTKRLPKVELHAHLTGSITPHCLHEIWTRRKLSEPHIALEDPLEILSKEKVWTIVTFFPVFSKYIYELCSTGASIIYSTNAVLRDFCNDGVVYLELRTTPRSSEGMTKDEYVAIILDCIENFSDRATMPTYLILSIDRRNNATQAMQVVDMAVKYRSKGVVGIDLCGDPSKGDVSIFKEAFSKAKSHGLKITLHFAEILGSALELELDTLLSYQPDRLGHVIHVPQHIKEDIIRKKIGIELCVSCNVQAKMTKGGVNDHHFGFWKDAQCPIALCTDDVGIFGSTLSNEYCLVAEHFGLSGSDLFRLYERSIEIIFGGEEEKHRLRKILADLGEELAAA